ncbi:MAG TPA: hypothetical protein VIC57_08475 [Candidatus Dormibacteraeota bacterium]|jgi:hypothetical protein
MRRGIAALLCAALVAALAIAASGSTGLADTGGPGVTAPTSH